MFRKKIFGVSISIFLLVLMILVHSDNVEASSVWEDAKLYWDTYHNQDNGVQIHTNDKDGKQYLYVGYRAKAAGAGTTITFANIGWNIKYGDKNVCVINNGKISNNWNKTVDGYVYNLLKIELNKIYNLFEIKYPNVDFSSDLRNKNKTLNFRFDSIMTYRENGVSKTYRSISEDGKGGLKVDGTVYYVAENFRVAYRAFCGVTLDEAWEKEYYNKVFKLKGEPITSKPQLSLPAISTTTPAISATSGTYVYDSSKKKYFVKANTNFKIVFTTTINKAIASFQANKNELITNSNAYGYYLYTKNVSGGTSNTITKKGGSTYSKFDFVSANQNRRGYTTLSAAYTIKQREGAGAVTYYGKGYSLQNDNIVLEAAKSGGVTVQADGTPPVISANGNTTWTSQTYKISAKASDALSGVQSISIYDSTGKLLTKGTSSCEYNVTAAGKTTYTVKAVDKVGNTSSKTVTVMRDVEKPIIKPVTPEDTGDNEPSTITIEDDLIIGWINHDYNLNIVANDVGPSGMKYVTLKDIQTGAVLQKNVDYINYTFTSEGVYKYLLSAADNAGNVKLIHITVKIDKTAPRIEGNDKNGTFKGSRLEFDAYDEVSGSGLKKFEILDENGEKLDEKSELDGNRANLKYSISKNFGLSYKFVAYDNAGNITEYVVSTPTNFKIEASLTSDFKNEKDSTEQETKYVLLVDENGYLNIKTYGYVDTIEIKFAKDIESIANHENYGLNYLLDENRVSEFDHEAIILTPSEESENSVTFKVPANVFDIEKYRNDRRMETLVQITGYRDGNSKTVTLPVLIAYNYVDYIHKTFRRVILG